MNNAQRNDLHFDRVAEQAKEEGQASIGKVSKAKAVQLTFEAEKRGCSFAVDQHGTGLFLDASQCRYDETSDDVVFF